MTITENPTKIKFDNPLLHPDCEHGSLGADHDRGSPTGRESASRGRMALAVAAAGIALFAAAFVVAGRSDANQDLRTPAPRPALVPSGSPFDAPITGPSFTQQVPSGSPFDRQSG